MVHHEQCITHNRCWKFVRSNDTLFIQNIFFANITYSWLKRLHWITDLLLNPRSCSSPLLLKMVLSLNFSTKTPIVVVVSISSVFAPSFFILCKLWPNFYATNILKLKKYIALMVSPLHSKEKRMWREDGGWWERKEKRWVLNWLNGMIRSSMVRTLVLLT